jgi:hypothetical protein
VTSPAELLLAELRAKVNGQLATLESVRTRAGVVLSASGVIAGLFAQHLSHVGNWGIAALSAFVVGGLPALWIIAPHSMIVSPLGDDWLRFANEHEEWVEAEAQQPHPDPLADQDLGGAELANRMAADMNSWYYENEGMLNHIHWALVLAGLGTVVQLACWGGATFH